jgi:hypothetical protein
MRRWLSLILIGVSFVLLLAIATSFALAYRARAPRLRSIFRSSHRCPSGQSTARS